MNGPTVVVISKPESNTASASIVTSVSPSIIRSTTNVVAAVMNGTPVNRVAAYARATSPARAGRRLLAMKPMAVACQRGTKGNFAPSSCRIYCHRMVRRGNTRVAVTTQPRNGKKRAAPMCPTTSARRTSCNTHHKSTTEIRSPATAALPMRDLLGGLSEAKLDEVEDFFQ